MPELCKPKPRKIMRRLDEVKALYNNRSLIGKQVRVSTGEYAGKVGKIIGVVTANLAGTQKRFVFYAVELDSVILGKR